MRNPLAVAVALGVALVSIPIKSYGEFFPYPVKKRTLKNGLDVLVIPTPEFKGVLTWNLMVLAGSRNEVEKGRSGLAHLFEHIAFRHKFEDKANSYDTRIEALGAFDNAWTWFDVTYYHPVTFASNLEQLAALQAERMVAMDFSEQIYRTEAGAVLGEYRRIASDPGLRMGEVQSDLMYGRRHGYGHSTMGYLADVKDMPNSYRSGRRFYQQYYRPNNAILLVAGDVEPDKVFALAEKNYGPWRSKKTPRLRRPRPVNGPKRGHVPWASDVPPRMTVAYQVPAFDPASKDGAAILLISELLGGNTAPLFKKLRYEDKVATSFSAGGWSAMGFHARPFEASVRFDKDVFDKQGSALLKKTEADIIAGFDALKSFSTGSDAAETLAALKSKARYDMLGGLNSAANVAQVFLWFYRFNRSVDVLDDVMATVDGLTPADIDAFARKHFVAKNRVVVTMTHKGATATASK